MAKMERNAFPDKSAYLGSALSLSLPLSAGKHSQREGNEELRSACRYTLNASNSGIVLTALHGLGLKEMDGFSI